MPESKGQKETHKMRTVVTLGFGLKGNFNFFS